MQGASINKLGVSRSWSRTTGRSVADSYENTLAETIDRLYKAGSPMDAAQASGEYPALKGVRLGFDNRGLMEPIGNIPPAQPGKQLRKSEEAAMGCVTQTKTASGNSGSVQSLRFPRSHGWQASVILQRNVREQ